jgi:hypothetical protein
MRAEGKKGNGMGLDQYLYRRHYVRNWDHDGNPWHIEISHGRESGEQVRMKRDEMDVSKIARVEELVMQWRKSNQIHAWFVRMVQKGDDDCGSYLVEEEQLSHLIDLCKRVLADHALAPTLLPAQGGFFFGSTDYDDWYFRDLEDTVTTLEPLIGKHGPGYDEYLYESSW